MTLDEVRRSLAVGMRVDGDLAQALDTAGIPHPLCLQTEAQVEELQMAIAAGTTKAQQAVKASPKAPKGAAE